MLRLDQHADAVQVYWSESGELVCLACEDTFYVLRFSQDAYVAGLNAGEADEDGVDAAFEAVADINERYVRTDLTRFTMADIMTVYTLVNGLAIALYTPTVLIA